MKKELPNPKFDPKRIHSEVNSAYDLIHTSAYYIENYSLHIYGEEDPYVIFLRKCEICAENPVYHSFLKRKFFSLIKKYEDIYPVLSTSILSLLAKDPPEDQ